MKDPSEMTAEELYANSSYNPLDEGKLLRVSKSSFMTYAMCPRKFWWDKIELVDIRLPPPGAMERGSRIHTALETLYDNWDGQSVLGPLLPDEQHERGIDEMLYLEEQRIEEWGIEHFMPVEYEEKRIVWDAENEVVLVGLIDAVLLHPDGGLCIYELKTGNMKNTKFSKTRRELCFYTRLLRLMGEKREITHFAYLSPDADDIDFTTKIINDKRRKIYVGEECGHLIVEKFSTRSYTPFEKAFKTAVENIKNLNWDIKWNDYFCPMWCDFSEACEREVMGFD
jgi:hypothetical protein